MSIRLNSILLLANSKFIIISWNHFKLLYIDRLYCLRKLLMTKIMFLIYLVTPSTFNVYNCYQKKSHLILLKCLNHIDNVNMFQLNYLLYTLGTYIITICTFYCLKAIYLISILQQACICFHGNSKKEVNLMHIFTVYKTWRPLSSIGSMQICHRPHHYWVNLFKSH